MAIDKLILHPADALRIPVAGQDPANTLQSIGLTGRHFVLDGQRHFVPGDNFLSLITFLGCSPAIETAPPEGHDLLEAARQGRFCQVVVGTAFATPQLRADARSRAGCPACKKRWSPFTDGYQGPATLAVACPHCRTETPVSRLDWRRTGGVARLFIDIWGIYPSEAVPGTPLMRQLSRLTDTPWTWFYSAV